MKKVTFQLSLISLFVAFSACAAPVQPPAGGSGVSNCSGCTITVATPLVFDITATLAGNISGNAGTVTNGVYTTGSYSNPSWITTLAGTKLTGTVTANAILTGAYSIDILGNATSATSASFVTTNANLTGAVTSVGNATTIAPVNASPGSYGSGTQVPVFSVNAAGQVTTVTNTSITGAPPSGAASGDLTGTYPSPTIANSAVTNAKIANSTIDLTTKVTGVLPYANGGFDPANQVIGGIAYIDASPALFSNANFTFNGSNGVALSALASSVGLSITTTSPGSNQAYLSIIRNNQANGQAQLRLFTAGSNLWQLGLRTGDDSVHFYDFTNSVDRFVFDQSGNLQVNALTASGLVGTNGSKQLANVVLTGDVTTSLLATTLATVNASPGTFSNVAQTPIIVVNGKGLTTSVTGQNIQIAESQVTNLVSDLAAKISTTLSSAQILLGNGSNVATAVTPSGDWTMTNAGVSTISNLAVTNAKIANSTIDLTAKVTGVLPIATGGSNATSANYATNSMITYDGTRLRGDATITATANQINVVNNNPGGAEVIIADQQDTSTSTSNAVLRARVGGTAAGDPHTRYTVTGGTDWVTGIDNSDSQAYVISNGSTPGSGNRLKIDTGGVTTFPGGDVTVSRSITSTVTQKVENTNNSNAAANARSQVVTGGDSGGDPATTYTVTGVQDWSSGIDNSDSDAYVISSSAALGTNNRMRIDTSGNVQINTTVSTAQLNVANSGSAVAGTSLAYFGSGGGGTAGNLYGIIVDKNGTDSLMIGVNKNTTTGSVAASSTFISTYQSGGSISIGRGSANSLPSTTDIGIGSTGEVTIGSGNVTINAVNKGLSIKKSSVSAGTANAAFVTGVTLVAGTVTINDSYVDTSTVCAFSVTTSGGTPGVGYRVTVASGTFTVAGAVTDTSVGNVFCTKGV